MAQFFTGRHEVPVDDKGRIFVPAEFRKKLPPEADDTLVVLRGFDNCLVAYSRPEWEAKAEQLLRLPTTKREARAFIRSMVSHAAEVKLDRQGRTGIPRKLLSKAGITNQMVIIGALDKLEFWSPENSDDFPPMEDLADSLEDFAIDL